METWFVVGDSSFRSVSTWFPLNGNAHEFDLIMPTLLQFDHPVVHPMRHSTICISTMTGVFMHALWARCNVLVVPLLTKKPNTNFRLCWKIFMFACINMHCFLKWNSGGLHVAYSTQKREKVPGCTVEFAPPPTPLSTSLALHTNTTSSASSPSLCGSTVATAVNPSSVERNGDRKSNGSYRTIRKSIAWC